MTVNIQSNWGPDAKNRDDALGLSEKSLVNVGKINENFKTSPDKAAEYVLFAHALCRILSEAEREEFANDPIQFKSREFLFRGLTRANVDLLRTHQEFIPQNGDLAAGTGVFVSDSPLSAFQYQRKETVAVLERKRLNLKDERVIEANSDEYRKRVESLLGGLDPVQRKAKVYSVDEEMDIAYKPRENSIGTNISLRKAQPLSAVKTFITYSNGVFKSITADELLLTTEAV